MWRLRLRQRRSGQTDAPISDPSAVVASRTYITLKFCNAASRTWGATCHQAHLRQLRRWGPSFHHRLLGPHLRVPTGGESRGSPSLRSRLTSGFVKEVQNVHKTAKAKLPLTSGCASLGLQMEEGFAMPAF